MRVSCVTSYHLHLITRVQDYPLEGKLFNNICSSKSRIARLSPSSKVSKASLEGTPRERRGRWGPWSAQHPLPLAGLSSPALPSIALTEPSPALVARPVKLSVTNAKFPRKPNQVLLGEKTCGQLARGLMFQPVQRLSGEAVPTERRWGRPTSAWGSGDGLGGQRRKQNGCQWKRAGGFKAAWLDLVLVTTAGLELASL